MDSLDYQDCQVALEKILQLTQAFADLIKHLENLQKLIELQRDLVGMDCLVLHNRVSEHYFDVRTGMYFSSRPPIRTMFKSVRPAFHLSVCD